jgi:hypothetical protein
LNIYKNKKGGVMFTIRIPEKRASFGIYHVTKCLGREEKVFIAGFKSWEEAWDFYMVVFRINPKRVRRWKIRIPEIFTRDILPPPP